MKISKRKQLKSESNKIMFYTTLILLIVSILTIIHMTESEKRKARNRILDLNIQKKIVYDKLRKETDMDEFIKLRDQYSKMVTEQDILKSDLSGHARPIVDPVIIKV